MVRLQKTDAYSLTLVYSKIVGGVSLTLLCQRRLKPRVTPLILVRLFSQLLYRRREGYM